MKRSTAIFAFLLISGPVGAMIEPGHQVVVAGKLAPLEPAPLENVAVLLRDTKDKVDLPLQCRLLPAAAQGEGLQPLQLINEVCRQGIQRGRESIAASSLRLWWSEQINAGGVGCSPATPHPPRNRSKRGVRHGASPAGVGSIRNLAIAAGIKAVSRQPSAAEVGGCPASLAK